MDRTQPSCPGTCGDPSRRRFFSRLCLGLGGLGAALLAAPVVGLVLLPLRRRKEAVWRDIGRVDEFEVGRTVKSTYLDPAPLSWAGPAAETAAWVRRVTADEFVAFGAYCTHVGCPVRWVEGAELFLCPCHGGAFHRDGAVAAGPPPRPLPRLDVRVREGRVELRTEAIQAALGAAGRRGSEE
ncbi:ubiquinol-cytochrome c reductase iron-sulfur subunit [Polyangium spumosum]|uniref:Rieske 2Fe-2S domain-containing protein n=1 Tax=Polyangium spumosum TaxID=889282 RepID=A0A6N7Q202_9BACT|nr:Rieske (2Fe-2S) protein [Polyangium spumosum]MRG96635.1 Rieske 2Fe-2S domain-containing protein [Polyangium spumosum]